MWGWGKSWEKMSYIKVIKHKDIFIHKAFRILGEKMVNERKKKFKLGRNNPCPCGSGKKYKKCCLPKDEEKKRNRYEMVELPHHWETKKEAVECMFRQIRSEGFFPCIDDVYENKEKDIEIVEIALVCPHGKSEESRSISRSEDGTWEWCETGTGGDFCPICEDKNSVCTECGKNTVFCCPVCKNPIPNLSEDEALRFYRSHIDFLHDTSCPKCGSSWLVQKKH